MAVMGEPGHPRRRDVLRLGALAGTAAAAGGAWPAGVSAARADVVGSGARTVAGATASTTGAAVAHAWVRTAYRAVLLENLTPPTAARAYAHAALAMYEAAVAGMPHHRSLAGSVQGLAAASGPAPMVGRGRLDWSVAVSVAARDLLDALLPHRNALTRPLLQDAHATVVVDRRRAGSTSRLVLDSERHGAEAAARVLGRALVDGHAEAAARPFTPPTGEPWHWVSTPPNFRPAIEPHCEDVTPFLLRSTDEVEAAPPVPFSTEPGSPFHRQAMAVLDQSRANGDAERATARYWTDNPGSFTPPSGTATGLPAGHWMRIASQAAEQQGLALDDTLEALVHLGVTTHDAFLACWTVKYRTNLLRPITYINRWIDPTWTSFVNTPQFPEHTSGHSVSSAAAAVVLTDLLGGRTFLDDTQAHLGLPPRTYPSFEAAALEAAQSRLFGGIHYPSGIEAGLDQGRRIGALAVDRLRTRR